MRLRQIARDARGTTLAELAVTLAIFGMIMTGILFTYTKSQEAYFVGAEIAEVQQNVRTALDFMVREVRAAGRDLTNCAFDYSEPTGLLDCNAAKVTRCTNQLGVAPAVTPSYSTCNNVFAIPIADATGTTLRIRAYRNDNGTVGDVNGEDVIYAYAAPGNCPGLTVACITRDDGSGPTAMVAVDVSILVFTYFPRPGYTGCTGSPIPDPCPSFVPATQQDADNISRIRISIQALQMTAGQQITRTYETDILLRNRS